MAFLMIFRITCMNRVRLPRTTGDSTVSRFVITMARF